MAIDFKGLEQKIKERGSTETLDNGLVMITENVPGSGLALGEICVRAGYGYENPGNEGVMHFLEHVVFGESKSYPDRLARNMRAGMLGLHINAETSLFNITFPVKGANTEKYMLQKHFIEALQIVSDLVFFPHLTEESMVREKNAVLNEIRKRKQTNASDLFNNLNQILKKRVYKNNSAVLRDGLGTEEFVKRLNLEKLKKHHSRFFAASNTVVGIVGDLDNSACNMGLLRKVLLEAPNGNRVAPLEIKAEDSYNGTETVILDSPLPESTNVAIYFQVPPSHTAESCAVTIANYILGGSANSMLFRDMRERKGLVYSISSSIEGHAKTGLLNIVYMIEPSQLEKSLEIVDQNIKKLKSGRFDARLVDTFKAGYLPSVLAGLQTPGWIQSELSDRHQKEVYGFETTAFQRVKRMLDITKQDVVEAANNYLGGDKLIFIAR